LNKAPDAFRTISEVAEELDLPQHVLRFWESRFPQIKPMKRGGGRRYYRPDDVDLLRGIRHLLYGEGYTIRGVQRILREQGGRFVQLVWQEGAQQPGPPAAEDVDEAESGHDVHEPGPLATEPPQPAIAVPASHSPNGAAVRAESATTALAPGPQDDPETARVAVVMPPPGLSRVDIERLRLVLRDLSACKKALEAALEEPA
jgi:DNA-binding transcriptional MerR regulator